MGLRPVFLSPRIPDFLSSLVALSNFMRLSLRETRIRGRGWCCVVGNPGNAGARGTRSERCGGRSGLRGHFPFRVGGNGRVDSEETSSSVLV
jgi:hypothetical protein